MRQGLTIVLGLVLSSGMATSGRGDEPPLPDDRLGVRTAPLLLLSRPDVRADLRLDEHQTGESIKAIDSLYIRANALRGKRGDAALSARRAIDLEQQRWLQSHLTVEQQQRLVQIDFQWEGPSALVTRPAVAERLALTQEQRAKLGQAVAELRSKRVEGRIKASDEAILARRALELLSEPQRAQWKALLGRPFTPQLAAERRERR